MQLDLAELLANLAAVAADGQGGGLEALAEVDLLDGLADQPVNAAEITHSASTSVLRRLQILVL